MLDQGIRATAPKAVRVRVQQGDTTVGLSIPRQVDNKDTAAVEADIRRARDGLFEEELFYELYREARSLIKHGVDVKRDLIIFPADDRRILIDLVDLDTMSDESTSQEDVLAESISQSFRILLAHAHRNNHRRRTQAPFPVTVKPRPTPEYTLLRPTVSYLDHKSHFQHLKTFLESLTKTLSAAGLHCTPNTFPLTSRPTAHASIESFLDSLLTPLESYITAPLCTPHTGFRIRIHTSMHPTTGFGTEFEIETTLPGLAHRMHESSPPLKLGLRGEVEDFILHMFTLDLVAYVSAFSKKIYTPPKVPESPFVGAPMFGHEAATRSGWDVADEEQSEDEEPNPITQLTGVRPYNPYWKYQRSPLFKEVYLVPWTPSFSAGGELASYSPVRDRVRKMVVSVKRDEVGLRVRWMGKGTRGLVYDLGKKEERGEETRFVWREGESSGSLEGVVEGLGREVKEETS